MEIADSTADRTFACTADVIWEALVTPDLYENWYGSVDGFAGGEKLSLGGKIRFSDPPATFIVAEFDPFVRFVLKSERRADRFSLRQHRDNTCSVTLETVGGGTQEAEALLAALEQTALLHASRTSQRNRLQGGQSGFRRFRGFFSTILQGYRTPVIPPQPSVPIANYETDAFAYTDVRVHPRAALAAAVCLVLLLGTLGYAMSFERGDIVPSSGLSLMQSDDVNRQNASRILMGQSQSSLELMVNCMGERLSPTEFYYCSSERTETGMPASEMVVTYDAYGRTRHVVFVNNTAAQQLFPFPFLDISPYLEPSMPILDLEAVLEGYPLSGFKMELSGVTTVYFGAYNMDVSKPDPNATSQLVVRLDAANQLADYDYFTPYTAENPLAENVLSVPLQFQYAHTETFVGDRSACERAMLIAGLTQYDAEIVLHRSSAQITPGSNLIVYAVADPWSGDPAETRYTYALRISAENVVSEVLFTNHYLASRGNKLAEAGDYALDLGMTLNDVHREMGILPTCLLIDESTLVLCYGSRINDRQNIRQAFPVVVILDRQENAITYVVHND